MAIPVEALSLSDITELASNPPRFPRNPTVTKAEPLVLYIARVPGQRDVIITPMKPRLKDVTAEDINSSLYYLHLDVPEDTAFIESYRAEKIYEGRSSIETIARKPVKSEGNAKPQLSQFSAIESSSSPFSLKSSSQIERKPVRSFRHSGNLLVSPGESTHPVVSDDERRPLGPRPLQSHTSAIRKPLPSLPGIENPHNSGLKSPQNLGTSNQQNPEPNKSFSITLIRRDPTSNAQWNIGKISSQPLFGEQATTQDSGSPYGPIYVYIDTPGYAKFKQVKDHSQSARMAPPRYFGFSQQVRMSWETSSNRRSWGSMDKQAASGTSVSGVTEDTLAPEFSQSGKAKGYVFLSPWDGQCSFSTSADGRRLKCRHTISGNGMKISTTDSTSHISAEVSELRFNLPNTTIFTQKTYSNKSIEIGRFAVSKFSHIKNKLSSESAKSDLSKPTALFPNPTPSAVTSEEDDVEDDDGLDQLGQEKAGGGNRGKRIKLAKLIVLHEGMQMLDLAVAANMGIFWKIWDR